MPGDSDNLQAPLPYRERVMTLRRLRKLLRNAREGSVPGALGEVIRRRYPEIHGPDCEETLRILKERTDQVAATLEREGVIPEGEGISTGDHRLTGQERKQMTTLAALATWAAAASGMVTHDQAGMAEERDAGRILTERLSRDSIRYARLCGDDLQLAVSITSCLDSHTLLEIPPEETDGMIAEALDILESEEEAEVERRGLLVWTYLRVAAVHYSRGNVDRVEDLLGRAERVLNLYPGCEEGRGYPIILRYRAAIALHRKEYRSAMEHGRRAIALSDANLDPLPHAQLLQTLGTIYTRMEHRDEGLQAYLNAISVLEENKLLAIGPWVVFSAVTAYRGLGDIEAGHSLLDLLAERIGLSTEEGLPENPTLPVVGLITERADLYVSEGADKDVLTMLDWAISMFDRLDAPYNVAAASAIVARHLAEKGEHERACTYLEQAIKSSHRSSRSHRVRFRLLLAEQLIAADRTGRAAALIEEIEPELDPDKQPAIRVLGLRAQLCEEAGELSEALRLEREAKERAERLHAVGRERSVRFGRIVAEIDILQQSIEKERDQRHRLEHALANAVVELGAKKEMIEKVTAALREESGKEMTSNRFYAILASLRENDDGVSTLSHLTPAADEFIAHLRIEYPELTTSQQRFCALIRFGYSSSEICSILDIGSEGLKSRRKRLRKALGLKKGEKLEAAIAGIG